MRMTILFLIEPQFFRKCQFRFCPIFYSYSPSGTEVFKQFTAEERIFSYDWRKYDFAHVVYHPLRMTPQELQDGYNYISRQFYSLPRIGKRTIRNWRYAHYFLPASIYYHWVCRHPKSLPEEAASAPLSLKDKKQSPVA